MEIGSQKYSEHQSKLVVDDGENDGKGDIDVKQSDGEFRDSTEDSVFLKLRRQLSKSQVCLVD